VKGLIPDTHPLAIGNVGFGAYPFSAAVTQESDVILAVGSTFSEGMTMGYGHRIIPEGAKIIQIDIDRGEIGKTYPVHLGIVGDAKQVVRALVEQLQGSGVKASASSPRLERLEREKAAWREEARRRGSREDSPITHWHIYETVRRVIRDDAAIVVAGCTGEMHPRLVATAPVYQSGDFRVIGHGLSSGVGMKYALPEAQVLTITGDGSFLMELQELSTAARAGFPLLAIVVHNSAYGNMKRDQIRDYDGRVTGTDLLIPDLPKLASSFGVYGAKVERPADLEPAMRQAIAVNGPALLDVICPIEGI
jgi:thiamine pyrophosphate-dependent acetolactate synthase large subunit-like protein